MFTDGFEELKKNHTYQSIDQTEGFVLLSSKNYPEGDNEKYWFGYRESRFEKIVNCIDQHFVFVCRNKTAFVLDIPKTFIDEHKLYFNTSVDDAGNIKHYHIVIHRSPDGKVTLLLSKPILKRMDISKYVVADLTL